MDYVVLYLVLGCFSGFVAGLFGIGGGMVIVPVLVFSFKAQGLSADILTHLAIGTSLATIVLTSLSAIWAHHQRGAVLWPIVRKLALGLFIGSIIGAQIAHAIPARQLEIIIGCFALLTAAQMFSGWKGKLSNMPLPNTVGLASAGSGIGVVSAIFGIGGGTFTVPYLTLHGVSMTHAVASASACGLPIAIAGALGFMWAGWHETGLPKGAWGFVFIPAFLGISATSLLFARVGAKLAHRLPAETLKKLFAVLLVCVGLSFILGH
ncbi:sulfite exporter TauE/SafE family protein [Agitococcus lubricus]|uniref:Probable membrane transporter protein n=1 Tax=Agitococcus lubricus TaxID=1077255 RepID=A0A2T5IW96_9GAMM|nr:sulfite exporter TauE/SafE family protein [Agitococcus lubricus]PTQ88160.1 hypothetical protein C8N29_11418 [Agitococcus lubricus]